MASFSQPIVIDNGSGVLKAGYAGEEQPKSIFPALIGRPKHTRVMAGGKVEGEYFIGPKAEEYRGLLKLRYPVEHGIITNWEDMEKIWNYLYSEDLKAVPEEHPVLLTEPALNSRKQKERAAAFFFETLNVPAIYFGVQAVLSLYATGTTTGIVLDSGDGVTHAVPVFEGFAVPNAVRRVDVAGRDVTDYLQLLLRKAGYRFTTSAEREIVRTIKEKACQVSSNLSKDIKENQSKSIDFTLPDGNTIKLGAERFEAPELLFRPEIIGEEVPGIHEVVVESILKTDIDLRKNLFSNMYLAGGSTLFKGFGDRLLAEVKALAPKDQKVKIFAPPERKYSAWIGGSVLASLSTFKKICITAKEFEDNPDIIHRKTF